MINLLQYTINSAYNFDAPLSVGLLIEQVREYGNKDDQLRIDCSRKTFSFATNEDVCYMLFVPSDSFITYLRQDHPKKIQLRSCRYTDLTHLCSTYVKNVFI